jgi:hypothetical protein
MSVARHLTHAVICRRGWERSRVRDVGRATAGRFTLIRKFWAGQGDREPAGGAAREVRIFGMRFSVNSGNSPLTLLASPGRVEHIQVLDSPLVDPMERLLLGMSVMQVPVTLLRGSRVIGDWTHLPLRRLALCLDCDECFELGSSTCPACGSRTWSPLARFIDLLSEPRTHRSDRRPARRGAAEARYLLVVTRHQREFYENIRRALAGYERVQVVLDRRVSQRRQGKATPALDHRSGERRSSSPIDEQLRTLGWALVPLDARAKR